MSDPSAITGLSSAPPRVTVLMPVYNRERYVGEAIRSVLTQDFQDFELLIVDDGSTDDTPRILQSWSERDSRVVVHTSPRNLGIPGALNLGLDHARAPYIARFDSDDVMMPRRLAAQAEVLDTHPEIVLVSSWYEIMDSEGRYVETWRSDEPHEAARYLLSFFNIIGGHGQVMYRLSDVRAAGGYATGYPVSEDFDLWGRLLERGRLLTLPLVGMRQRQHSDQSVVHWAGRKRANWRRIMRRSLVRYLGRPVSDGEIDALITVWRFDGAIGMAPSAERTMREGFRAFRAMHPEGELHRCVGRRTARQWLDGARWFAAHGQRWEAMKYVAFAARWSPAVVAPLIVKLPSWVLRRG